MTTVSMSPLRNNGCTRPQSWRFSRCEAVFIATPGFHCGGPMSADLRHQTHPRLSRIEDILLFVPD
ncbi:unnamed protein product [Prunus armeniaca]|uniref:Uncharacterized protein n=1 Tax=Prunus armeniaca TaxID=36596 RepID=A0A6J5UHP8_PRUAR|nr:unnamed protein product [Prunus armeniaca]